MSDSLAQATPATASPKPALPKECSGNRRVTRAIAKRYSPSGLYIRPWQPSAGTVGKDMFAGMTPFDSADCKRALVLGDYRQTVVVVRSRSRAGYAVTLSASNADSSTALSSHVSAVWHYQREKREHFRQSRSRSAMSFSGVESKSILIQVGFLARDLSGT